MPPAGLHQQLQHEQMQQEQFTGAAGSAGAPAGAAAAADGEGASAAAEEGWDPVLREAAVSRVPWAESDRVPAALKGKKLCQDDRDEVRYHLEAAGAVWKPLQVDASQVTADGQAVLEQLLRRLEQLLESKLGPGRLPGQARGYRTTMGKAERQDFAAHLMDAIRACCELPGGQQ